jgi:hypothetical protein
MSLVLDHINGVANDHRLANLQLVCANCAATLDTHCGRNIPRGRECPSLLCAANHAAPLLLSRLLGGRGREAL